MAKLKSFFLCSLVAGSLMLCSGAAAADLKGLWEIGKADNSATGFALAPDGYGQFERDARFVVGQSDPAHDWPYCHPGPADFWAGGRAHTFTIYFGLKTRPTAACRLIIDLLDTHPERPPKLRIAINGQVTEHQCPPGGADASIQGRAAAGKEHLITLPVPAGALKAGLNELKITNSDRSWVVYDSLRFLAPADADLAPAAGAFLLSAKLVPWLSRGNGRLSQELTVTVMTIGPARSWEIRATGVPPVPIRPVDREQAVALRVPPVTRLTPLTVELWRDGECVDARDLVQQPARERARVDYVDCLLGTATSRWMLYPGPCLPFGMVKLSPDNQHQGWKAGYEYTIENIAGFSHIHSWTMGGLLTMPTTGPLKTVPGAETDPDAGYRSRFKHETEVATPGYYAVTLDDYGIRAELTASTRAGWQRYTFPRTNAARILFDLLTDTEYGYDVLEARIRRVSDTEIEGYAKQRGRRGADWNEYTVHFVARLNRPFTSMGGWVGQRVLTETNEIAGQGDVGCFLNVDTRDERVVQLKTGISLVSIEQARLNLDRELNEFGWDFDACRKHARAVWNQLLGAMEVEGGTETDKVKFYSNFYHSYCARTIWSDVSGKYVDMYEKVRQLPDPDSPVYGCDAFWNTFWNLNQLWILAHPDMANKWVRSLLEIYDQGGWLPKGPTGIEYSSIMVASHEIALIVAAYQAGIRDYDVSKAYEAIRHVQTHPGQPHPGGGHVGNRQLTAYLKHGYVPVENGPVSNTLEYAYDDWCVAQMALALGRRTDYEYFLKRSLNYRNVFDPLVGFTRRRHANGDWVSGFSPFDGRGFVEGNAWQFTWFAPHDVGGLVELLGPVTFNSRLEAGLERSLPNRFNATGDRMADYPVNHGNQPNMQSCWLFNYSGKPWLAQKWSRAIMDAYYGSTPRDGYPGDEDQGQMGAWYVMAAIGLFQMDGGCATRPIYELGSPLFDRIVIHLDPKYYQGKQFIIEARNNSKTNIYIQSARLNGVALNKPWFYQADVTGGGKLELEMGPEPNKNWGSSSQAAPPSVPRKF